MFPAEIPALRDEIGERLKILDRSPRPSFSFLIVCAQNFYMIGKDKSGTLWKVLKINRTEPTELNIREDSTTYSDQEGQDLLKRVHEGNRSTGGLRHVTKCYGIVGNTQISFFAGKIPATYFLFHGRVC